MYKLKTKQIPIVDVCVGHIIKVGSCFYEVESTTFTVFKSKGEKVKRYGLTSCGRDLYRDQPKEVQVEVLYCPLHDED